MQLTLVPSLVELLSGSAFRPGLRDSHLQLSHRLEGRDALVIFLGSRALRTSTASFRGGKVRLCHQPLSVRPNNRQLVDHLRAMASAIRPRIREAILLLPHGWTAELSERTPSAPGAAGMSSLRVPHPLLAGGIQFQTPANTVNELVALVEAADLQVVRVQIPAAAALSRLCLRQPELLRGADVLIADPQSLLFITCDEGRWGRVRFASSRPGELASDISRHLRERIQPSAPLVLAGGDGLDRLARTLQPEAELRIPELEPEAPEHHVACLD